MSGHKVFFYLYITRKKEKKNATKDAAFDTLLYAACHLGFRINCVHLC